MASSVFWLDKLAELAGALDAAGVQVADGAQYAIPLLLQHGYGTSAQMVQAGLTGSGGWCEDWATSLRERIAVVEAMTKVALVDRSPDLLATWRAQRQWALNGGSAALSFAAWPYRSEEEYSAVAAAMLAGQSSVEAGLDPAAFPAWYRAQRPRSHPSAAAVASVAEYLDAVPIHVGPGRHRVLGAFLARLFAAHAGDPGMMAVIAEVFRRHVDSTAEAVAFFNAVDPELMRSMAAAGGLNPFDASGKAEFTAPFAAALAGASHSPELEVDAVHVAGGRDAAYWFMVGGFADAFLVASLVAAVGATSSGELGEQVELDGAAGDARTLILRQLAAQGPGAATAAIRALDEADLLDAFVNPRHAYADDGEAAGGILAQLGRSPLPDAAGFMVDVAAAVGAAGGPAGVLQGAAAMVQPHLGGLPTSVGAGALPETPLRPALDTLGEARPGTVTVFLEQVMADAGATRVILRGYSTLLAAAVAASFDPDRPESVAGAFADSGRLYDLISDAYLGPQFAVARGSDRSNRFLGGLIGVATDLAIGLALVKLAARPATQLAVETVWGSVVDVAFPLSGSELLPTDRTEAVLIEALAMERDAVFEAQLLLAVYLDAAGLIRLPPSWWVGGALQPPSRQVWESFVVELYRQGFPVDAWFNHAAAIGGYADFEPPPD